MDFIPSLNLQYDPNCNSFFVAKSVEKWLTSPQNRPKIEGYIHLLQYISYKLDEAHLKVLDPEE